MSLMKSLSGQVTNLAQAATDFRRMSRLRFTPAERANLVAAFWSSGQQANLLGFRVSYLNRGSFRYALREVFFEGDYLFDAGTDEPVILDCGSNIGLATLFFKRLYPKARIACFEADPTTAAVLQKNVEQNNLQNVATHNLMLSNSEGEHSFYVASNVPGSLMMSGSPDRLSKAREIRVKAGRLSDYIDGPVDLLKMDVEGAEFEVMADLEESGKIAQIQRMVIEYHHKIDGQVSRMAEFLALLQAHGFEYQISGHCYPITKQDTFQDILIGAYRRRADVAPHTIEQRTPAAVPA
jgi:FkbM family methyltransferase